MPIETYQFAFDRRFVVPLVGLGVRRGNSRVVLTDTQFAVRFGWWQLRSPISNLKDVRITRDYRWFKGIGARGSMVDRGVTFGTNTRAGVCVCFHEPVTALAGDWMLHPAATVTVEDPEGFAEAVRRRIDAVTET